MEKIESEAVRRELSAKAQRIEPKALAARLLFQPVPDEKPDRVDQLLLEINNDESISCCTSWHSD